MGRGNRWPEAKRQELRRLLGTGMPIVEVVRVMRCAESFVQKMKARYPRALRKRNALRLSLEEREEISRGLTDGESLRSIARRLKRQPSTVSREVAAQGKHRYRAWRGEERAEEHCRRQRPGKLESNPQLVAAVEEGLAQRWSPEQIAHRLKEAHPENGAMHVSHETIYRALYIQGRGTLRKELTRHLRSGRTQRKQRTRAELRGRIRDMVNISKRPPEVEDRAVPGHWEGDLIVGPGSKSSIGTLVERTTRFVMLLHLPDGHSAEAVRLALTQKLQMLPAELRRSLTWDQGMELSQHAQFTIDTGVGVFFCDPRSPWQRGSNENTNGLLRQYFPKSTDLSRFTATHLDDVARELNGRPRQTLNWRTPSEQLNELLR
jgi:transposase, IS30 family